MIYSSLKNLSLAILASVLFILSSCEQSGKVPFPKQKLSAKPPVTEPLAFSAPKKVKWDTISKGNFTPIVQKLDINELPTIPYDSTGFKPFAPPEEVAFDFENLPKKDFHIKDLPAQPIELKTSIMGPALKAQAGVPSLIQGKALDIYNFGKAQGFMGNLALALYQDNNGLLWIGGDGLWQYDGNYIKTYVQKFPDNSVVADIIEDKLGNIWFSKAGSRSIGMLNVNNGTISQSNSFRGYTNNKTNMTLDDQGRVWLFNMLAGGVSIINPKTSTYQNLDVDSGLSDSIAYQVIQDADQNMWITTTNGVSIVDIKNGAIKYLKKENGLSSNNVQSITQSNDGRVWIASAMGIDAIDVEKGTIKQYRSPALASPFKFQLKFDDIGQLWIASPNGVIVLDATHGTVRSITQKDGLKGINGFSLASDKYHRMWVGSVNGMSIIAQNAKTVHPFGTIPIISTSEDEEGNLWVATQNGLYIVNPERTAMRLLDTSKGLTNNFVQAFFRHNGNMLVTTDGGFNIIDVVNNTILKAGKKQGLSNDTIYSAISDKAENIWLTGPSNGVDLLKPKQNILLHTDRSGGLSDNAILDIKQNSDGTIWLATQNNGVDILDPETGTIKNLKNKQLASSGRCRIIHEDEYGRMWIGTEHGIYVADNKLNTLSRITTQQGLTGNSILSLLSYKTNILAGTNNMISIIKAPTPGDSASQWQISPMAKSEGILKTQTSWATDAITDEGKYYWGDNGMIVIHEIKASQDSVPTYITGMSVMTEVLNFVNHYSISKTDTLHGSDTLYVNGDKPVDTGYIEDNKISYDSVSGKYNLPVNLILPNEKNYLQFHFMQANLGRLDSVYYTYILEGIDRAWSTPTRNNFSENYLNLPGGKYTFKVSSRQVNGQWSQPVSFSFTISPPWYQTWWAYTIFVLIGLAILRVYIVYRSRRLKRLNRVLEERVSHRTSQLKETIEELKATQSQLVQSEKMASLGELTAGIAHEIQNPLNFVNNFAEINTELIDELKEEVKKKNYDEVVALAEDIKENEQKIVHHGKRADGIVKGMLQHSRNSSGTKEPTDINVLADEYLRLAYHGLRAKDKSFNANMETNFDEHIVKVNVIPQDMGRVILNLITNAFYAVSDKRNMLTGEQKDDYKPTVTVSTKKVDNEIEIKVTDNGNGIPQKVRDKIFQPFFTTKPTGQGTGLGLSMSYDIVTKAHGGILKVDTEEDTYTTFTIILPIE